MELPDGGAAEEPGVVPLHSDFGPAAFQPYALDLASAGLGEEDAQGVLVFVVLARQTGYFIALPELSIAEELLQRGQTAAPQDFLGPSLRVEVASAVLDEDAIQQPPQPLPGRVSPCMLVDFTNEVQGHLAPISSKEELHVLSPFDFLDFAIIPDPDSLVSQAHAWARGDRENVMDRIQYYSADEVPETPAEAAPKRSARRRRAPGAGITGEGLPTQKRKPTVASLAESLEALTAALPVITDSLQDLKDRTAAIEAGQTKPSDRTSALRRPLGGLAMPGSPTTSTRAASLVKDMPPPRSTSAPAKQPRVSFSQANAEEMEMELEGEQSQLAKAMLAQTQALTTLVSHLASNSSDPFQDLSSSTSSLSTKGAVSRARLQAELAAHKGVFFTSVIQSMARRMQPSVPAEVEMSTLRSRGLTPTQYLKRFGGFGRTRDIGFIIWQVALAFNHMMEDNNAAARDALSLLFVCLEQTAMDQGNMQVGLFLAFADGRPTSCSVFGKVFVDGGRSQAFCADSAPALDHNSASIPEGDGRDCYTSCRGDIWEDGGGQEFHSLGFRRNTSSSPKEEAKGKRNRRRTRAKGCKLLESSRGGELDGDSSNLFTEEISFCQALACLPRWILRTRTRFSAFLARTFHIRRCGICPASAVFPIPVPCLGLFDKQVCPKLSSRRWHQLCILRTIHVAVMASNYIYSGCTEVPMELLGRRPNSIHLAIVRRIRSLLSACDRPDLFPMPPGRSSFEFIAKLIELERFAGSHEAFCPDLYSGAAEKKTIPVQTCGRISEEQTYKPSEQFSPVHPYRSLNAARLRLSGTGSWNLADHLDDILWLPFVEPGVLFHHVERLRQGPDVKKEDETENLELAKLWDSRGLLALFPSPHPSGLSCRVVNAHKNATSDRQIGDRRWFNSSERHPSGPSRFLPAGPNMTSMHCDLAHRFLGCASDRKDFYHQAAVSRERALTNILPMPFEAKKVEDTHAWSEMIADLNRPASREEGGDRYGMKPRSLLAPSDVDRSGPGSTVCIRETILA